MVLLNDFLLDVTLNSYSSGPFSQQTFELVTAGKTKVTDKHLQTHDGTKVRHHARHQRLGE